MQCVTHLADTTRIQSLQALCCAGLLNDTSQCAICPNPDLAGIGVRVAFYLQSLVNGSAGQKLSLFTISVSMAPLLDLHDNAQMT